MLQLCENNRDKYISELRLAEYKTLREEIDLSKRHMFQILSFGVVGIPLLLGSGFKYNWDILLIISPFITIMFELLILFEQNCLMRAGAYIHDILETKDFPGWEHWLESHESDKSRNILKNYKMPIPDSNPRMAETFFSFLSHFVFIIYYLIGTALSTYILYIRLIKFGIPIVNFGIPIFACGFYIGMLLIIVIILFRKNIFPNKTSNFRSMDI